jgi:hypothetical protein
MSRQIKLKAWIAKYKIFTSEVTVFGDGSWGFESSGEHASDDSFDTPSDGDELIEYTGLKDKNGVEIYEGDILKWEFGRICEVIWHEHCAMFDARALNSEGISRPLNDRPHLLSEVIGNIHENPELIA